MFQLIHPAWRWKAIVCCTIGVMLSLQSPGRTDEIAGDEASEFPALTKKWTVLWDARRSPVAPAPLPDKSSLESLDGFELTGIPTADRFQLRSVKCDGAWGSKNRWLVRMTGKDSALRLARGDGFEMEGIVKADGRGGWFILLGWDKGHGYGLYNVTLKESGSVWFLSEFRDGKAVEETHREVSRFVWKGNQPMNLQVVDGKLTLKVGRTTLLKTLELPNYRTGDIILGTYDTPYGPKPVAVGSLRIRAK